MFHTNLGDVPLVRDLRSEDGWVNMQVQFLVDQATAGTDAFLLGWTVLPPGARHDRHRHADEFFIVLDGHGEIFTNTGRWASVKSYEVFTRRGNWHGFDNTGDEDVVLVWGSSSAESLEAAGYETGSS